jgi:hypothetical protein
VHLDGVDADTLGHPAFDPDGVGGRLLGEWLGPRGLLATCNALAGGSSVHANDPTDAELRRARDVYHRVTAAFDPLMSRISSDPQLGSLIAVEQRPDDECRLLLAAIGVIRSPDRSMPKVGPNGLISTSDKSRPRRSQPPGRMSHTEKGPPHARTKAYPQAPA